MIEIGIPIEIIKIGFVFQKFITLITHQTVLSNVELALTLSGVKSKERKKKSKRCT